MARSEPTVFTKTIRSHPWHDHAARVVRALCDRAPRGALLLQSLEGGHRSAQSQDLKPHITPVEAMAKSVEMCGGKWGDPLELPPEPGPPGVRLVAG